ncbi:60Kd inner membrane protein-domain-containing protein [Panaeolus papilionaceus]|nr:60Kd inner membrane protein-domain-containing protein [Panaeolus papilionaceus]
MFALTRARPSSGVLNTLHPSIRRQNIPCRRFSLLNIYNESILKVGEGFLDLSLALPIPPSLPPYSTTIILFAAVSRIALFPITLWGWNRLRRLEDHVIPELKRLKPQIADRVAELASQLVTKKKKLFDQYRCSPGPAIWIPPLSQVPVFLTFSVAMSRLSMDPTPFDSESFLTLTTLSHPDPTMALPIALGFLTMAQIESGNWFLKATERTYTRNPDGTEVVKEEPFVLRKTVLRLLSVARIIVAAVSPGAVALYWVSSATFALFQTWVMHYIDLRRSKRALPASSPKQQTTKPRK